MKTKRNGVAQHDLVVGVVLLVLLVFIIVPMFYHPCINAGVAQLGACKSNLKGIHTAIKMYETAENGLPVMRVRPSSNTAVNAIPITETVSDQPYSEAGWDELGDQAMQNMWLLIANNNIHEAGFHCPADMYWEPRDSEHAYGWTNSCQYSYSIQWPYEADAEGNANPAPFQTPMDEDLIIMADRNPGGPVGEFRPPSNHGDQGTVVVTWRGTVSHQEDNSLAGIDGDDIYTNADGEPGGMPVNEHDTSLSISPREGE